MVFHGKAYGTIYGVGNTIVISCQGLGFSVSLAEWQHNRLPYGTRCNNHQLACWVQLYTSLVSKYTRTVRLIVCNSNWTCGESL